MRVEESKTHECEFKLEDISEEEWDAMFLEGLQVLVNEAREGNVDDYIVVPYRPELDDEDLPKPKHTLEISDEDTEALVQIGAVSMIKKGLKLAEENDYWKNLEQAAKDAGEEWEWNEERADIVGQNGNDGLHYVYNDDGTSVGVQHKMKDSD